MSLSSVIEKCISLVTGKGSESEESSQQEQNFEQNQQEQSWEPQAEQQQEEQQEEQPVVQNPEFYQDSDM